MEKLTRRSVIYWHRKGLWHWLYKNPVINGVLTTKEDWPRWEEVETKYGIIDSECFACEFSVCCIFDWGVEGDFPCLKLHSPYAKWLRAKTAKTRKKYAKIIRDLPLRKGKWGGV